MSCVPKVNLPQDMSQLRPFTVYATPHRCFASTISRLVLLQRGTWFPKGVRGSLPGRSSKTPPSRLSSLSNVPSWSTVLAWGLRGLESLLQCRSSSAYALPAWGAGRASPHTQGVGELSLRLISTAFHTGTPGDLHSQQQWNP